jgi:hypothetical protein
MMYNTYSSGNCGEWGVPSPSSSSSPQDGLGCPAGSCWPGTVDSNTDIVRAATWNGDAAAFEATYGQTASWWRTVATFSNPNCTIATTTNGTNTTNSTTTTTAIKVNLGSGKMREKAKFVLQEKQRLDIFRHPGARLDSDINQYLKP